jgi:hypothetical protein
LGELRRQYEMARYNHMQLINEIRTTRRLEMIEIACASFYAFITFFHEGHHVANSTKLEVEAVNAQLYPYKLAFQQQRADAHKQVIAFSNQIMFEPVWFINSMYVCVYAYVN